MRTNQLLWNGAMLRFKRALVPLRRMGFTRSVAGTQAAKARKPPLPVDIRVLFTYAALQAPHLIADLIEQSGSGGNRWCLHFRLGKRSAAIVKLTEGA